MFQFLLRNFGGNVFTCAILVLHLYFYRNSAMCGNRLESFFTRWLIDKLVLSADIVRHTEQCVINPNDVIQHIFDSEEVHNPTSAYKFEFKTSKTIEELAGNTLIITDNTYENVDGTDEFIPRGIMHCCQIKMAVTQQMVDDWDPQG